MNVTVVSILFLTQETDTNIKVLALEQVVSISDAVEQNMLPQSPLSRLYPIHSVELEKTIALSASSTLSLNQSQLPRSSDQSVTQICFVWHDAELLTDWPLVRQSIVLTQSATYTLSKGCYSNLDLSQEVSVVENTNITVPQSLVLISKATGYLPSRYWTSYDIDVVEP